MGYPGWNGDAHAGFQYRFLIAVDEPPAASQYISGFRLSRVSVGLNDNARVESDQHHTGRRVCCARFENFHAYARKAGVYRPGQGVGVYEVNFGHGFRCDATGANG